MAWYDLNKGIDFSNPSRKGRFPRIAVDREKLLRLYIGEKELDDIAKEFNVSRATVTRHLKFLVPKYLKRNKGRTGNLKAPFNEKIIKLYTNDHFSTERIGSEMDCSAEKVRKHLILCGVQMRGRSFKNVMNFHPKMLCRKEKRYPFNDLKSFNSIFTFLYCLNVQSEDIAGILNVHTDTVMRRIKFLKATSYFKLRFCRKCSRLFRFASTEKRKNGNICPLCLDPRKWNDSIRVSTNLLENIKKKIALGEINC
ncbi:MAG: hypothetical protein V1859_02380 [archaeon]